MPMATPHYLVVVFAKGASRRLPGKNLRPLGGKPLLLHTLEYVNRYAPGGWPRWCVSEDAEIQRLAALAGWSVLDDPYVFAPGDAAQAADRARRIYAEFVDRFPRHDLVRLQCTSPFREPDLLARCIARLERGDVDSVLSAERGVHIVWSAAGELLTHDWYARGDPPPGSESLPPTYRITGSIAVRRRGRPYAASNYWAWGRLGFVPENPLFCADIDTAQDFQLAELRCEQLRRLDLLPS
jgi:N-acylneuraminate cytidylyltransferase